MINAVDTLRRGVPAAARVDLRHIANGVVLSVFFVVLLQTAWLGDDAYITFRTVDNLVAGYGPRWNVAERVQTYTHPLWMWLLALPYSVTREAYFTPLCLTMALSLAAMWLLLTRLASSWRTALVGGAALVFSKAFVDYSTSGLENPLTHFLLAVFICATFQCGLENARGALLMWVAAGLLMVNRLDLGLLVLPAAIARSLVKPTRAVFLVAVIGLAPVVLWELFSIVYYGFPFPNTAYAKLPPGMDWRALVVQGVLYFIDAFGQDPVTPLAIVAGLSAALVANRRESAPFAIGAALYLLYVVRIGGDFMIGRLLSPVLFFTVALFVRIEWRFPPGATATMVAAIAVLGIFATTRPPMTSGPSTIVLSPDEAITPAGIGDERAFYYRHTGLLRWSRAAPLPFNSEVVRGRELRCTPSTLVHANIGFFGYFAGPRVHIIDPFGLGDPLLARLPALPNWRVGHYLREVPAGYVESVRTGRNLIVDPRIAKRYERLKLITQGPLWSRRRWTAVFEMNRSDFFTERTLTDSCGQVDTVHRHSPTCRPSALWNPGAAPMRALCASPVHRSRWFSPI